MPRKSAGILLYKKGVHGLEVFLVHPGGPFWTNKDVGAWSIPKGEFTDEDPLTAAKREFAEETGMQLEGDFRSLTPIKQAGGKWVYAWACEGDIDAANIVSNFFKMEWPLKSGKYQSFPEVDRADWFGLAEAKEKLLKSQLPLLEELEAVL